MRVGFHDHRGMGAPFAAALTAAGHTVASEGDVLLADHDAPFEPYSTLFDRHQRAFLYPHGANVVVSADGIWPVHDKTAAQFVIGEGHAEVLEAFRYPRRVVVTGWPFGGRRPFRKTTPRRVLFAPSHPIAGGWMPEADRRLNGEIHDKLAGLPVSLRVRHLDTLALNGITPVDGVRYYQSNAVAPFADIDTADVVVSSGTFAALGVAAGCPTVMVGQDNPPADNVGGVETPPASWESYRDACRYPHDASDGDLWEILQRACADDAGISEWRRRFVGEDMNPARFVEQFESLCAA